MATSTKQITANQQNAQKSSGPKSADGKAVTSRNATRHGLLSARLFLQDEKPQEFQQLFDELAGTFNPSGIMEMVLLEKIAVAIWKQRRIVAAETGAISLRRQNDKVIGKVNNLLNITYSPNALTEADIEPFDKEHEKWCQDVLAEYDAMIEDDSEAFTFELVQKLAPECWQQLQQETEDEEEESAEAYLKSCNTELSAWMVDMKKHADTELAKARQRPKNIELFNNAFAEQGILSDKYRESFERYQASLDNQLYKAMKELRQLQEWRLNTIETVPVADVPTVPAAG